MSRTIAVDPVIDSSMSAVHHTDVDSSQVTYRNYPATSWSDSNIVFNVQPPSMQTFISRAIRVITPIRLTFGGSVTPPGAVMLDDGFDALRSMADLRIQQNTTISINGVGYPVSTVSDILPDILEHYSKQYRAKHPLGAPDVSGDYHDSVGTVNNPLASYSTSESFEGGLKRGAFAFAPNFTSTRGATSAVLHYNLVSWLYIPGLLGLDCDEKLGLTRVRTMDVNQSINLDPKYVWSHATGGYTTIASCVIVVEAQPTVLCKFLSCPPELVPKGPLCYNHLRFERFTTNVGGPVTAGSTVVGVSNNIQLSYVPRYIFAWFREQDSLKTITSSDTFLSLQNVSANFNNQAGLLSSAQPFDLWNICLETGIRDSLPQFQGVARSSGWQNIGTMGSLFCAEFGRHISLGDPHLTVGSSGAFNFNLQLTAKNNSSASVVNPVLYLVVAYDQIFQISEGGECLFLTPESVLVQSESSGEGEGGLVKVPYNVDGISGVGDGGSFKTWLEAMKAFAKKHHVISRLGEVVGPLTGPFSPAVSELTKLAKDSGYGGKALGKLELKKLIQKL